MAKATKLLPVSEYRVTLELSQDEAQTLRGVTERIGGSTHLTKWRFMAAIGRALADQEVLSNFSDADLSSSEKVIYFL